MLSEAIFGLVGVIIGSILTYWTSKSILKQQFETQQAYEFISTKYLPLLNAIIEYKSTLQLMKKVNEVSGMPLADADVALKIRGRKILQLREALEKAVKSGIFLVLGIIDKKLAEDILDFGAHLDIQKFGIDEGVYKIEDMVIEPEDFSRFEDNISRISVRKLIKEYQNLMKE